VKAQAQLEAVPVERERARSAVACKKRRLAGARALAEGRLGADRDRRDRARAVGQRRLARVDAVGGQNAPARSYSMAARYSIRKGLLAGVRLGLTYQYAAEYLRIGPTATATAITVPFFNAEVSEWSAVIGYAFKRFKSGARLDLSLNVNNLLDEKEMTTAAYYPEGRTVRLTAGLRF
jgi:outer membrane receptor protein involved in Fe transport